MARSRTTTGPGGTSGGGRRAADRSHSAANGSGRRLVIVESPAKARKIASYLGSGYVVESSRGHIRDLPRGAADVPAKYKGESWARLGVDVDHSFEPLYVITPDKRSTVTELRNALKSADELYLATDGDREGEAIAWHLMETLKPTVPVRRMVFHEITAPAIRAAAENPRDLDQDLVDAQETRRILDRLYGYEVSPVLWRKVMPKLSAGRVQSVATRIIVRRERERMAFVSASYWDLAATLSTSESTPERASESMSGTADDTAAPRTFGARLVDVNGRRVATGRDFGPDGQPKRAERDLLIIDEAYAGRLAEALAAAPLTVSSVEEKPYTRRPYAPFMTSTLQQEAGRKLRFSAERTMRTAQRLYENGYITYMRTDSITLSETAISAARAQARELYGDRYLHDGPRQYTRKVKNAQEAHEAIRPAGEVFATPGQLAGALDADEFRLYELIWQRTVASQMADARGTTMSVRITGRSDGRIAGSADGDLIAGSAGGDLIAGSAGGDLIAGSAGGDLIAGSAGGEECTFAASGRTITFAGFLKAYVETVDDEAGGEADDAERKLPQLTEGQHVTATELVPEGHTTTAPPRYTEASLVKALEELGIGRPSTYASIINTIQDRGYVWKRGSALVPSWVGFAVIGLLEQHFGCLVDYDFTAAMEDELDSIASGAQHRTDWLTGFYFGSEQGGTMSVARFGGLKKLVGVNLEEIDAREVNSIPLFTDDAGREVVVRVGRYGPYLVRTIGEEQQRANLPDDLPPDELTAEIAEKLFATPIEGRSLGTDPVTGHEIVAKEGRYGPYVTEVLPEEVFSASGPGKGADKGATKKPKPRTGSLFKSMSLETVNLDDALRLLALPRVVGTDPDTGQEITAQNGRYGPYLKRGTDSRSLADEEQIFTVTLDEALKVYAEPKRRGRQATAKPPLRELAPDPVTGKPMVVKEGRFGPYVTDGEGVNASLRKGDSVETLTDERAAELLAARRASAWHHGGVNEQMSDALFGVDGTELPESRPDPSGRSGWRDASELPPMTLPAMPDLRMTPEAIAAALGEDLTEPVDQDPDAAPARQPAAPPSAAPPDVPQANVPQATVVQPPVVPQPPVVVAQPPVTAPLPTPSAPQTGGPPSAGEPGHRPRPVVHAPAPPAQPSPRRLGGLRYRPPLAAGSRTPGQLVDLRRRVSRQGPGLPLQPRSNGGAGAFFLIALITFGVLAYSIIAGIVESISKLFQ